MTHPTPPLTAAEVALHPAESEVPARKPRLLPARGLVCAHNRRGAPFAERDLARWLRINRMLHKADKCDVLVRGPVPPMFASLLRYATASAYGQPGDIRQPLLMPLSLRTDCPDAIPELAALHAEGLLDLLLCPDSAENPALRAWLEAAADAGVPARVQIQPPFSPTFDPQAFVDTIAGAGVPVLTIVNEDPFHPRPPCADEADARRTIDLMNALATAAQSAGIEANIYGIPLAFVAPGNRILAGGRRRFFLDHQQYNKASYEWAERLYRSGPRMAALAIAAYLGRYTSIRNLPDEFILRWVIEGDRRAIYQTLSVAAKFIRRWRLWPFTPEQRQRHEEALAEAVAALKENGYGPLGIEFDALHTAAESPGPTAEDAAFMRLMPGLAVDPPPADAPTLWEGLDAQHKYYDRLDRDRLDEDTTARRLAEEATRVIHSFPADIEFSYDDIRPQASFGVRMPGAYRWHTLIDREVQSVPIYQGDLPFTVQITVGGGIADFAGFSIWDAIKIVSPMDAFSHVFVLHAAADGRFVLLRDGIPVRPVEFEGQFHTPRRLPTYNEVRASLWNINADICTQTPRVWTGPKDLRSGGTTPRHSVLIVSTRYARRLQAVLTGIAHQEGVALADIEVIVGYVPGIDATDDVLNSVQAVFPDLRIVRSPFPERRMNAKGFIINQSLKLARGEWVTLLDSDIVVPRDLFARLDTLPTDRPFAAPQGRKMLPQAVTARILLGEARPWREWDDLLHGPGEERYGDKREGGPNAPIGFCQCVRRHCFETVRYNEYENFEGADWEFACAMLHHFGPCHFLDVPVLHLDHGGSQWYGAQQQQ